MTGPQKILMDFGNQKIIAELGMLQADHQEDSSLPVAIILNQKDGFAVVIGWGLPGVNGWDMVKLTGYLMLNALEIYQAQGFVMFYVGLGVFFDTLDDLPRAFIN